MTSLKTFLTCLPLVFVTVSQGNAGPVISAECTKMSDGRLLVYMTPEVSRQAEALGYRHEVCSVKYEVRKFSGTSSDEYGNLKGVCLIELQKWRYLPSGVCE